MTTHRFQTLTTDQLRPSDLVLSHGMRLQIDHQPTATSQRTTGRELFSMHARITNWPEVIAQAPTSPYTAGFIAAKADTDHRWTIQGDRHTYWTRDPRRRARPAPESGQDPLPYPPVPQPRPRIGTRPRIGLPHVRNPRAEDHAPHLVPRTTRSGGDHTMSTDCPQCGPRADDKGTDVLNYEPELTPHGQWLDDIPASPPRPINSTDDEFPFWEVDDELNTRLRHLLSMVLEVLNHQRPADRLRNMLTPRAVESLRTRARYVTGTHYLRTVRACCPTAGVVEVSATVRVTRRIGHPYTIALAGRVEQQRGEWICTNLRPLDVPR